MPYFITDRHPECANWAVVKEDGELLACHATEDEAIDQMVAVSLAEDLDPGGTYDGESFRALPGELVLGDFVSWDSSGGTARGQIEHIMTDGVLGIPDSSFSINASEDDPAALIRIWRPTEDDGETDWNPTETLVGHRFSTLTKIDSLRSEIRQVNLEPPRICVRPLDAGSNTTRRVSEGTVSSTGRSGKLGQWLEDPSQRRSGSG